MPLTSKTFSQLIDFTRTSAATYVDQLGRIVPTPVSLNLLTFTQEVDNAAWGKQASGVGVAPTVTANAGLAPDGTTTADRVQFNCVDNSSVSNRSWVSPVISFASGLHYTASVWVKAFDPSNVGRTVRFTVDGLATAVITLTADWQRAVISGLASTTVVNFLLETRGTHTGQTADVLVWGAQLEQTPDANLTLGSELVTNGDFASGSTGWTLDTGITVTSNQLVGATTSNQHLRQSIGSVGSRVYRVSMTVVSYTSGSPFITIGAGTQAYIPSPSVTGTKTFYVVAGSSDSLFRFYPGEFGIGGTITVDNISVREVTAASPSTYTRNFGGRFLPRFDYDPVTLAPRGLLIEEQRTNLLLRSEEFDNASWQKSAASISANVATSPDGTVDADALVEDSTTADHIAFQPVSFVSGTAYTVTVYAKADTRTRLNIVCVTGLLINGNFDLSNGTVISAATGTASITPAGNGWYRCQMVATAGATTNGNIQFRLISTGTTTNYAGNGTSRLFLWGAQCEAGAFATSYIPTTTSQVTRTADSAAITGANFSPWYNAVEGTFLVEASAPVNATTAFVYRSMSASDGTNSNLISTYIYDGRWGNAVLNSGAFQADMNQAGSYAAGAVSKTAAAYRSNDFAASVGGNAALTDASGTVPSVNRLFIGSAATGNQLNGHIRSIRYYPTRLTNAQLQALTA